MKKLFSFATVLLLSTQLSFGQKTEVFLSLNSGLSSFSGPGASETSALVTIPGYGGLYENFEDYTANPFSTGKALFYGLSAQFQRVFRGNFIAGISVGYENIRSKTLIDKITWISDPGSYSENAIGKMILSNHFAGLTPYLGYRIGSEQISLDLTGGVDVGYLIKSKEDGEAETTRDLIASTDHTNELDMKVDARPRIQLTANYRQFGVYAGYSRGLSNYVTDYVNYNGTYRAHSELFRFGILYKIKG